MYEYVEVESIEELEELEDTYDITVESTHNFFANDLLVHNCMGGEYAQSFWLHKDEGEEVVLEAMRETTRRMVAIFGKRWYAEIQWNAIPEQHEINKLVIKVAKEFDLQIISTADSHYPNPEAWQSRLVYKKLGWMGGKGVSIDDVPKTVDEVGYELYPKNGDQMWAAYKKYTKEVGVEYDDDLVLKSIELTHDIAHNVISDFTPDTTIRLPDFVVPKGKTADEALSELVEIGLKKVFRIKNKKENIHRITKVYTERIKYELSVIAKLDFAKYFLTMNAIAEKAVEVQLAAPGRGSAAGSIVAYALGITQIDPIKYNLQFERFLRADATDMPDIDYDVAGPAQLKDLLIKDWGANRVVPITNWNTLQLKSLVKDISKLYDIPFAEVNAVTGKMVAEATPAAKKANGIKAGVYVPTFDEVKLYSETLRKFLVKYPHVESYINALYGSIKSQSKHAGGCVIGEDLNKYMPLISGKGIRQTPWSEGQNVRHLEPMGFIKFDILGLTTLEMIDGATRHILKRHMGARKPTFSDVRKYYDENLHPDIIDLNDQKVYKEVFHKGKWAGIFQFTGEGAQNFCSRVKPKNIVDISAITSIFRPAALSMKVDKLYIEARKDPTSVEYLHPLHKEVTEETFGFLVFQEQIASLAHKLGKDISLNDGNVFRKVLTKKGTGKADKVLAEIKPKFIAGCIEKGIAKKDAEKLYHSCELWSGYGFNLSHAISYSVVSYQCAWLMTYYPVEWLAAFLDAQGEAKKEEANNIIKKLGYKIRELDVNTSGAKWEIDDDNKTLIQPLSSIKGVGDTAIKEIVSYRPFANIEELLFHDRVSYGKLNKKNLDVLCRSGALSQFIDDRFTGAKHFWSCVAVDRPKNKEHFDTNIKLYAPEGEFSREERILNLIQLTGVYPVSMVVSDDVKRRLSEYCVPPLGEYDPVVELAWFIPKAMIMKKTARGKDYVILEVIDNTNTVTKIKCWGYDKKKDVVHLNRPYMAKLDYSEQWGFSTRSIRHNLKLLG